MGRDKLDKIVGKLKVSKATGEGGDGIANEV